VRRRSVVVDRWKTAFRKSRQAALREQVHSIAQEHQEKRFEVEKIKSKLGSVEGCTEAFSGLGSDEDRVEFIRKAAERNS